MPNGRTAIVTDLGNLFTVRIDPSWKYASLWASPIGPKLSVVFLDYDQGFVERSAVRYADTDIIGRSEQIKTYMGTDSREISLLFQFHVQGISGSDANQRVGGASLSAVTDPTMTNANGIQNRDNTTALAAQIDAEVMQPSKFLDALKYPLVTPQGVSVGAPPLLLTIGQLLTMRCIATAVELRSLPPFDPETLLPFRTEVAVTFTSTQTKVGSYNFNGPSRNGGSSSSQALSGVSPSGQSGSNGIGGSSATSAMQ